jgi:uncharacterized protein
MERTLTATATSADAWRVAALTMMGKDELQTVLTRDIAWIKSAAAFGIPAAQLRLGRMLLEGEGIPRDRLAAFQCFEKAASAGDTESQNMLGRCYENGWGTPVNYGEAVRCYRVAAEDGLDWAQYNLGHVLLSGNGTDRDPHAAFQWYSRAASQGHVRAMNLVGRCCEEGWGTSKDLAIATAWYRQSACGGYFRGAFNYACFLAESGCTIGAKHWFGRALATAPEPTRSNMIKHLTQKNYVRDEPCWEMSDVRTNRYISPC